MAEAQAPKSKGMERVKGLDLYELLGVEVTSDAKTIKKAYRKKALTCHPDKNPDDKKAIELFHQLSGELVVGFDSGPIVTLTWPQTTISKTSNMFSQMPWRFSQMRIQGKLTTMSLR